MKMVSSQMIGVAPLQESSAISSVQATFSVSLQVVGSPVSPLVPFRLGPRHCGQFSAAVSDTREVNASAATAATAVRRNFRESTFSTPSSLNTLE